MLSCSLPFLIMATITLLGHCASVPVSTSTEPESEDFVIVDDEFDSTVIKVTTSTTPPSNNSDNDTVTVQPDNGTVLAEDDCPPHSVYTCPTKCDPSCTKPLAASNECPQTTDCPQKSCVCVPGYVYDEIGKKCILSQSCPDRCKPNEVWRICPSACLTHCGNYHEMIVEESEDNLTISGSSAATTISSVKPFTIKRCPEDERDDYDCEAGCVCREGFLRDLSTGVCVTRQICDVTLADGDETGSQYPCPKNEHMSSCINDQCIKYCHHDHASSLMPLDGVGSNITAAVEAVHVQKLNETECNQATTEPPSGRLCIKGCVCDTGYMRLNIGAKCILEKECNVMLKYLSFTSSDPGPPTV